MKKGMTLIEVIVSVTILLIAILATTKIYITLTKINALSKQEVSSMILLDNLHNIYLNDDSLFTLESGSIYYNEELVKVDEPSYLTVSYTKTIDINNITEVKVTIRNSKGKIFFENISLGKKL